MDMVGPLSAEGIQLGRRGKGRPGPIGRIFGREHAGADARTLALRSRTRAAETLCLSARKFSQMVSAGKFHLVTAYTKLARKLFQPVAIMWSMRRRGDTSVKARVLQSASETEFEAACFVGRYDYAIGTACAACART